MIVGSRQSVRAVNTWDDRWGNEVHDGIVSFRCRYCRSVDMAEVEIGGNANNSRITQF